MVNTTISNVLVVEDEPRVRQLVAKALRRRGFVVLEADGAEAALRLFGDQAPDIALLLTDLIMPGMNGDELALKVDATALDAFQTEIEEGGVRLRTITGVVSVYLK